MSVETVAHKIEEKPKYVWKLVWGNILLLLILHIFAIHGLYFAIITVKWETVLWGYFLGFITGQGITAGAHRLWAHRSYKAKLPLKLILCFFQTLALQTPIYDWVRDHRVHHKYVDTDADPHNATRGFFFSHMGWLLIKKHNDVVTKGKNVDLSDLRADSVVMFQKKYHKIAAPFLCLLLPALVPWYFFEEKFYVSWCTACVLRYVLSLHATWAVNSAAHMWGNKPYDKDIKPTENLAVAVFAFGEGWHNYHHVFPWDYKTGELGGYRTNITTAFIDLMAKLGWAYERKCQIFGKPFLYHAPQALTSLVSSASAASSGSLSNIAKLPKLDDDDFFKESLENSRNQNEEEGMKNEASPSLIQNKINKIVQKIRFLSMLTNSGNHNDDDFQKERDAFDKEFEEDFGKEELVEGSGYFYNKPDKVQIGAKQETTENNRININPANIGVFFMELIGSLVGLAYGAAAQLNYGGSTTAPPST
ncbi:FA desaturase domain containing protein [Asbolus verrucosus]|uniref:FA desaturase domain containing protein n=1 Tax=Asbolus verrucosus TaxID=1661398 RepID=A0A482VK63_ASBVE|nr:FA desaturase domain containing protein [Asbolus verrucosus]